MNKISVNFEFQKFIKVTHRTYPPFYGYLIMKGFANEDNFYHFLHKKYSLKEMIDIHHGDWYFFNPELARGRKLIFQHWSKKNKFYIDKIKLHKLEKRLDLSLNGDLNEFTSAFSAFMPALILPYLLDEVLDKKINKLLLKYFSRNEAMLLKNILNQPLKDNFYKREEYDLLKTKNLKEHVQKYIWIKSRYGEIIPYTIEEARQKLKKINKTEFLNQYRSQKRLIRQTIQKVKSVFSVSEQHLVDLMQFIVYYRTQRTDLQHRASFLYAAKLKKLAKKLNLTYQQLLFCTPDEILNNHIPSIKVIKERIKNYALIMHQGNISFLIGKDAQNFAKNFDKLEFSKSDDLIKGQVAFRGLVNGRVKIILSRKDFSKFKKGDILITSMTTTEMLSIMKKASAFVTDEGGITCHAAIISRELKKPCIVGTKIVTKLLHDGDLVKVDANKGVVKIIKKNEKFK